MVKNKYIFIDLDETLIRCDPWSVEPREGDKEITLDDKLTYRAFLRPRAHELLKALREIAPCYLLTAATQDYSEGWNHEFDLGFKNEDIYSRNAIAFRQFDESKFPPGHTYLIDNLPRYENRSKIEFLREIDPAPKYFNIKEYCGFESQNLTVEMIQEIVDSVTE
jgi:hypothetical protein